MTTMTGTDPLAEIDLSRTPPCEVIDENDILCRMRSVCRFAADCPEHGTEYAFTCASCRDHLLKWGGLCMRCPRELVNLRIC